jgi:hypothetical protein
MFKIVVIGTTVVTQVIQVPVRLTLPHVSLRTNIQTH